MTCNPQYLDSDQSNLRNSAEDSFNGRTSDSHKIKNPATRKGSKVYKVGAEGVEPPTLCL